VRVRFTGLRAWQVQRVSAIYMLLFLLFVLGSLGLHAPDDYGQWKAWVARPALSVALLLFFATLLGHMWVGLRDVLLDYARPPGVRHVLLAAVALSLLGLGIWLVWIVLRLQG